MSLGWPCKNDMQNIRRIFIIKKRICKTDILIESWRALEERSLRDGAYQGWEWHIYRPHAYPQIALYSVPSSRGSGWSPLLLVESHDFLGLHRVPHSVLQPVELPNDFTASFTWTTGSKAFRRWAKRPSKTSLIWWYGFCSKIQFIFTQVMALVSKNIFFRFMILHILSSIYYTLFLFFAFLSIIFFACSA